MIVSINHLYNKRLSQTEEFVKRKVRGHLALRQGRSPLHPSVMSGSQMRKLDELPIVFYNEKGHLSKLKIDQ